MIHHEQGLFYGRDCPSIIFVSHGLLATHPVLGEASRPTSDIIQSVIVHGKSVFLIGMRGLLDHLMGISP
jgi:hypothetical protein